MLKQCKLAIIIPAYKPEYLAKALMSIADQTCKDFNLYIGDDCSPYSLAQIVRPFEEKLNLKYHRFTSNFGGSDLISQWERCINLSLNEEWIWLFSDDDIMSNNCVELFYNSLSEHPQDILFHIDIDIIDEFGEISYKCKEFPSRISGPELFSEKINLRLSNTVVEYIFKRELFLTIGGFVRFDLAWNSDDATWIKMIGVKNVLTIKGCKVFWRYSRINISSLLDKATIKRKLDANIAYLHWIDDLLKHKGLPDYTNGFEKLKWMMQMVKESNCLKISEKFKFCIYVTQKLGLRRWNAFGILYLTYSSLKRPS